MRFESSKTESPVSFLIDGRFATKRGIAGSELPVTLNFEEFEFLFGSQDHVEGLNPHGWLNRLQPNLV